MLSRQQQAQKTYAARLRAQGAAAEREACAVVAEQYLESPDPALRYVSPQEIAEMIAADIRKRNDITNL
jgi:hypothetical protein